MANWQRCKWKNNNNIERQLFNLRKTSKLKATETKAKICSAYTPYSTYGLRATTITVSRKQTTAVQNNIKNKKLQITGKNTSKFIQKKIKVARSNKNHSLPSGSSQGNAEVLLVVVSVSFFSTWYCSGFFSFVQILNEIIVWALACEYRSSL